MRLLALLLIAGSAHAATTITEKADSGWQLMRGTTNVGTPHASLDACKTAARADAESRKASADYRCRQFDYFRVTYSADPTAPPTTWTLCATDPGYCTVPPGTTIRFGVSATDRYLDSPNRSGTVWCDISSFGGTSTDPAPGVRKSCYVPSGTSTQPPPSPVDVCQNIDGAQATVPVGMVKDAAGNCVPAPTTPPPSGTTAGPRVTTFTPSGPITATSGQVIAGVSISNPGGACITVPAGVTGVVIRDSRIGPCGGSGYMAGNIVVRGQATIEHNLITQGVRGVAAERTSGLVLRRNVFDTFRGPHPMGKAAELNYMTGALVEGNLFRGRDYASDVLSAFESRNMQYIGNDFDVHIAEPSSAAFTIGDGTGGDPGGNNYAARNVVRQQGTGVPAGVFGSSGNTVLEYNCFTAGIQAYNYSGVFVGVVVRKNAINLANSFVPDPSVIAGWDTNVNTTDCSKVPQ